MASDAVSEDAVLGGRLRLRQPLSGHRVGHDAILLAASVGAKTGEHAVDLGAGVGGAGLALASRVPGLKVTLVEIEPSLATLASENVTLNELDDRVAAIRLDATNADAFAAAGLANVQHVLMNPPFNDPAKQRVSPDATRRLAHAASPEDLPRWIDSAARLLAPGGTLTMIFRADRRDELLDALKPAFGALAVLLVLPRPGAAAIRVLVRARKGAPPTVENLPDLVLNEAGGRPSAAAEAVLRRGETLGLANH
jgi:tRNA1(Val) A37 N6-methylase TrmN6